MTSFLPTRDSAAGACRHLASRTVARRWRWAGVMLVVGALTLVVPAPTLFGVEPITIGRLRVELERLVNVVPNSILNFVVDADTARDGSGRIFLAERSGRVKIDDGSGTYSTFLDLSGEIYTAGDSGLLGIEFHPGFADSESPGHRKFYTYHMTPLDPMATVDFPVPEGFVVDHHNLITEWQVDADNPNLIDVSTRREIFCTQHVGNQHHAGTLEFGPDGYLYGAIGTTAQTSAGLRLGQDPTNIIGTMYRIDPLDPTLTPTSSDPISANGKYRIPADNPFLGDEAALDEVFAFGLRNPYRFSVDPDTGLVFVGDVGQGRREEVNVVPPGGNMGWPYREGTTTGTLTAPDPNFQSLDPIAEYTHDDGQSVIGGYVYRGSIPELQGKYIFAEFSFGNLGFFANQGRLLWFDPFDEMGNVKAYSENFIEEIKTEPVTCGAGLNGSVDCTYDLAILGFATDEDGELYIVSMRGSRNVIDKIVSAYFLPEGDYNEDGVVDAADYETWKMAFGTPAAAPGDGADGNRDGVVNAADYIWWRNHFLAATGESLASIPEPSAALLTLVTIAAGLFSRARRV